MSPTRTNQKKYVAAWIALVAVIGATLFANKADSFNTVKANESTSSIYNEGIYDSVYYDVDRDDVQRTQFGVYYDGEYYDCLGGLDSLLDGTYSGQDIKEGLRALIGYQSIGNGDGTYVAAFGKNIVGTDEKHPRYKGTKPESLADVWQLSERSENDEMPEGAFRLFYANNYGTSLGDYSGKVNREHVWPQSLSGGLFGTSGAGADGHHIRPCNQSLNGFRSNKRYGDLEERDIEYTAFISSKDAKNYNVLHDYYTEEYIRNSYKGEITGYSSDDVFEPTDEYKGDIARIIAYMALHYESLEDIVDNVMVDGYETIIEWNELDPVDSYETNRNNVIADFQGNRNPFIDAPELVNVVFGDKGTN
ncbi:MAG: hypothetical protein E7262_08750 [Lachnospiraceae bacterium]|nr:hypothetical protein [Lachnospiraceae bacterium]